MQWNDQEGAPQCLNDWAEAHLFESAGGQTLRFSSLTTTLRCTHMGTAQILPG